MKHRLFSVARGTWARLPDGMRQSPVLLHAATRLRASLAPMAPPPMALSPMAPAPVELAQARLPVNAEPEESAGADTAAAAAATAAPAAMQVLRTLDELDAMLLRLDAAAAESDDALRRLFATFRMEFPLELPADADSPAYRAVQFRLYEWLHGKPYAVSNEASVFDLDQAVRRPFPYSTLSADTVGHQLIAIGHLIRTLALAPGQSVLEFGPGWGNTTVALARIGCRVTAVDVERNFLSLIARRAAAKGLEIETIEGDFGLAQTIDRQFDAVLFFECFHHCADHHGLVAALQRIVAPGGKVVFAAEPILDEFPLPWGLRLDGESLWAIRRNGWLELGFQETYFRALLDRHGWQVDKVVCPETPWGVVFVATRKAG
jgi:SAM-dependent methyltransferase